MTGFDEAVVVSAVPPEELEEPEPVEPEPLPADEVIEVDEPDALDPPPPLELEYAEEEEDEEDEPEDAVAPVLAKADVPAFFLVVLPLVLPVGADVPPWPWLSPVPPVADPPWALESCPVLLPVPLVPLPVVLL